MHNHRIRSAALLALLLPMPALAELAPVGSPLEISSPEFCSSATEVEVIATPKGAFEVVWVDDGEAFAVKGRRFARNLQPSPQRNLLFLHGGLNVFDIQGTWADRYELALNVSDTGDFPDDPVGAYRLALDVEGRKVIPPTRRRASNFGQLVPAAKGDSLLFRGEPPLFGSGSCFSQGLLARRITVLNQNLSSDSRVNRGASPPGAGGGLRVERLPNDTFVAVYSTCERFTGLVARRLSSAGAPVGSPVNLPFTGRLDAYALAARSGTSFAVAARVTTNTSTGESATYTRAVVNGQVFGPTLVPGIGGDNGTTSVVDLAASPDGGYLLLFQALTGEPRHAGLFAQELDDQGVPRGTPLAITGQEQFSVNGAAVASLPHGRWIVIAREQLSDELGCSERLFGTVLAGE